MKLSTFVAASTAALANAELTRCGNDSPPAELQSKLNEAVELFTNGRANGSSGAAAGAVDTYVHIVTTSAKEGSYSQSQIQEQISVMNSAYEPTGYSFNLVDSDFTTNNDWATAAYGSPEEAEMKRSLKQGTYADLNLYFLSDLGGGLLGFCYFPQADPTADDIALDGCVNLADSLPGGAAANYDLGITAVHETGHWFGLFHVFQGESCTGDGDFIADTPAQREATSGCPAQSDTCPDQPGLDSIHNFMDYSYDECLYEFTDDQITRLQSIYSQYRAGN